MNYSIKQVSEHTKLKPHVLRYYEREGLLPSVGRSGSGIRVYSDDDMEWLGLIRCLKNTGMSIRQIKHFVELSKQGDGTLDERCRLLEEHRRDVEAQIAQMQEHLKKVSCKIDYFTAQCKRHKEAHHKEGGV